MSHESDDRETPPQGRLDTTVLGTIGSRAQSHPLVESWRFEPDSISPRYVAIVLDGDAYPDDVDDARLDVRWFDSDDYNLHYVETRGEEHYQCRWDRHSKSDAPRTHFHPPPDAGAAEPSPLDAHHLDVLFTVLDWVAERLGRLYDSDR